MTRSAAVVNLDKHPCYSPSAHFRYGRMHLPVAPDCNLGCNYCEREIGGKTYHSYRPAVADRVLTPEEALRRLDQYLAHDASLAVVGIAGPGEPLCQPSTFETLQLVSARYPALMLCVSTNGLLLRERAEHLWDLGVRTLTVTMNTVDPTIGERIYAYVEHGGKRLTGLEGAKALLESQLAGLEKAAALGFAIKVNSILLPGLNDGGHLEKVAGVVSRLGAHIQNITPLIPLGRFRHLAPPSCHELRETRLQCERIIKQFRLCRQCPADAVGIPGEEHPPT